MFWEWIVTSIEFSFLNIFFAVAFLRGLLAVDDVRKRSFETEKNLIINVTGDFKDFGFLLIIGKAQSLE